MEDRVTQYAENIVSGKTLAGKPVIATAKRHLNDLEKSESDDFEYYFDAEKASRIIKFIEMLPNTTTGDAMQLAPFQAFVVGSIHGWRYKKNGHRRFNKATISLSRKQGKTLINAGMAIYELIAGESPSINRQIFLSSNSREQSMILFKMVKQQVDKLMSKSPAIRKEIRQVRNEITHNPTYSIIKPTSADYSTMDGNEVSFGIIDEYAASPTTRLLDVIESSQIQLDNPLIVIISTAGYDVNAPFYAERNYAIEIAEGKQINENYFSYVAMQDSEKEINDPETWIKSNPLLEVPELKEKMLKNLEQQLTEAQAKNDTLEFRIKNLNLYVKGSVNSYIDVADWEACATEKPVNIQGKDVYFGIDLARVNDIAAVSMIYPTDDNKMYVDNHSFIGTKGGLQKKSIRDKIDYEMLANKGYATITDLESGIINYSLIMDYIVNHIQNNNLNVKGIMFDSWGSDLFLAEFEKRYGHMGLPFIEVGQGFKNLSEPIKQFRLEIYEKNIIHNDNPNLNIAINNAIVKHDNNANIMLVKDKAREKIDPIVALITAYSQAMFHEFDNSKDMEKYILSEDFGF